MCQISGYGPLGMRPTRVAAEEMLFPSNSGLDNAPRLTAFVLIYRDACLTLWRAYVE